MTRLRVNSWRSLDDPAFVHLVLVSIAMGEPGRPHMLPVPLDACVSRTPPIGCASYRSVRGNRILCHAPNRNACDSCRIGAYPGGSIQIPGYRPEFTLHRNGRGRAVEKAMNVLVAEASVAGDDVVKAAATAWGETDDERASRLWEEAVKVTPAKDHNAKVEAATLALCAWIADELKRRPELRRSKP